MPYIAQEQREQFEAPIANLVRKLEAVPLCDVAGLLNYVVTKIVVSLWVSNKSYSVGNTIVGALHCIVREFCRRHLDDYEDEKIEENGDVTPV